MSDMCDEALERLYEFIDNELPEGDIDRIGEHLLDCPPCEAELRVNEKIKEMVRRCSNESAPEELRARILATIASARGDAPGIET